MEFWQVRGQNLETSMKAFVEVTTYAFVSNNLLIIFRDNSRVYPS